MALTPDVAAGTIIQSAWGNEIRDRTVQRFATVAERNTWTDATKGALAVTTDTNTLWQRGTSTWAACILQGKAGAIAGTIASGTEGLEGTITYGVTFAAAPVVVGTVAVGGNFDLVLNWTLSPNVTTVPYRVVTKNGTTVPSSTPFAVHWVAHGLLA